MRVLIPFIAFVALFTQCGGPDNHLLLQGTWKTDSIYSYYNGFGFTRRGLEEEPLHHYEQEGRLRMTRGNESRSFFYDMRNGDTLIHRNLDKEILETFLILNLNTNRLVLKKEMRPIFGGIDQERSEVRYFSRVTKY